MTIDDTCRCGATLRVNERNHVAAAYRHEAWLKAHAICRWAYVEAYWKGVPHDA